MKYGTVTCFSCGKEFQKDIRHIHENMKIKNNFYCSPECLRKARTKTREVVCESCGRLVLRKLSDISPHNFSSHSCAAKHSNVERGKRSEKNFCIVCGKQIPRHRRYCSWQCSGKGRQFTEDQLIAILIQQAKILGRSPSRRECQVHASCAKHFGTWNGALIAAGLSPNRSLSQRMYKRRVCTAKDGHTCNSVSELIIDNWLADHHISHDKEVKYPDGKHVADW